MNGPMAAIKSVEKDPEILLLCRDVSGLPVHLLNRASVYVPTSGWTFAQILEGSVALVPLADSDTQEARNVAHWEQKKVFLDAVVAVGTGLEESVAINDACRLVPVPFFWLREVGQILSLFVDPGKDELILNPNGYCRQDNRPVYIYGVAKSCGSWLVYTQIPHDLQNGDIVTIQGCPSIPDDLHNANLLVEKLSSYQFLVNKLDVRMDVADICMNSSRGHIRLVARENEPKHTFHPLRSNLTRPQLDHFGGRCCKSLHVALLKKLENNDDDFESYKSKFTFECCKEELTQIVDLDCRLVENISGLGLGVTLVLHQINNLQSGRFRPIKQWGYITTENLRPSSLGPSVTNTLDLTGKSIVLTDFGPLSILVLKDLVNLWSKLRFKKIVLLLCAKDSPMETAFSRTLGVSASFEYAEGALSEFFRRYPEIELEFIEPSLLSDTITSLNYTDFWKTVGMIITTKASLKNRGTLAMLSVDHKLPLMEVGVDCSKAHLQTILPGVTEIRNTQMDPVNSDSAPHCVVKSFPRNSDDCVAWARNKTVNLLVNKPANYNEALQEQSMSELVATASAGASNLSAGQLAALKVLRDRCETWTECVAFARRKFEKYFKLKALTLLHNFPPETESGQRRFWDPPKNIPSNGIEFTPSKSLHLNFIKTLAHCWATLWRVPVSDFDLSDEQLVIVLSAIKMDPQQMVVKSKPIVTDESVRGENPEEGEATFGFDVDSLKELALRANSKDLEMKIPSRLFNSLLEALANLRGATYRIPMDMDSIVAVASKTPSCSLEASAILSQLIRIEVLRLSLFERYPANWWVSLLDDPWIARSDSVPCSFSKLGKYTFSSWDKFDVYGNENWTMNDFLADIETKFGQEIDLVIQGTKMIFVEFMPSHQKRRSMLMKDQIIIKPGEEKVVLFITVRDESVTCPPINYYPS